MLEINSVPVNFKGKENKLIKLTREATKVICDSGKTAEELAKDNRMEAAINSYYKKLSENIMLKLNLQRANITYKK